MSTDRHEAIERIASEWLARRDSENWSSEDQQSFDAWFNQSMANRVAYWRLESTWDSTQRLKALGAGIRCDQPPPPGRWNLSPFFAQHSNDESALTAKSHARRKLSYGAMAAGLALATSFGLAWVLLANANRYETRVGALASLPMDDGSKVVLNTASEIKVAMTAKERRIELEQGEAFFDVARDPARPFVVVVGDKRIVAVGTKFSVRRDLSQNGDDIQVVVTEGSVQVESTDGKSVRNMSVQPLTAGTVARANRDGLMLQKKDLPEAEEALAWRSGMLVFRDSTLADAAAEFNRYNRRKIVIEDAETSGLRIMGTFRATNVDAFVRLLEQGYPVRTEDDEGKIVVRAQQD